MHILIVEDDPWLANTIKRELTRQYSVDIVSSGRECLYSAQTNQYDLITLDIGLPDMNGLSVCRQLRERNISCAILMLTGDKHTLDTIEALNAGADDYLTKPFNFSELRARIGALLRRGSNRLISTILTCEDLELDTESRMVRRGGDIIQLRRKEHDLLELLMRHQGTVVNRETILEHIWDTNVNNFTNAIDVHIKHLRDRIDRPYGTHLIQTIYGFGYRIGNTSPYSLRSALIASRAKQ